MRLACTASGCRRAAESERVEAAIDACLAPVKREPVCAAPPVSYWNAINGQLGV
jgi:hypothetical protein